MNKLRKSPSARSKLHSCLGDPLKSSHKFVIGNVCKSHHYQQGDAIANTGLCADPFQLDQTTFGPTPPRKAHQDRKYDVDCWQEAPKESDENDNRVPLAYNSPHRSQREIYNTSSIAKNFNYNFMLWSPPPSFLVPSLQKISDEAQIIMELGCSMRLASLSMKRVMVDTGWTILCLATKLMINQAQIM